MASKAEQRLQAALDTLSPQVRKAFDQAIRDHVGSIDVKELERLIADRRFNEAIDLLRIKPAFTFPLTETIWNGYTTGGAFTKADLPLIIRAQFGFGNNPRADQWARTMSSEMVERIDDNLEAVQTLIADAANNGVPNARVALDITGRINSLTGRREGGLLGLNSAQTEYVISARAELARAHLPAERLVDPLTGRYRTIPNPALNYLTRTRRNHRFDPMVQRAIRDGKPLTAAQIDNIAGRYSDRLLALRGSVIARDQTLNALRAGQREGWLQAVESGTIKDDEILRTWLATSDARTRHDHMAMNGLELRGMAAAWTFPDGRQALYPGDASLGALPADLIQCFAPWVKISRVGLLRAMRRDFSGDLIELSSGGVVNLTVTANHPILTARGWVVAGEIQEGDKLFNCTFANFGAMNSGGDVCGMEATAERLYDLAKVASAVVRSGGVIVDFDSDVADHNVDIVAIPRGLGFALEPGANESIRKDFFARADVTHGRLIARRLDLASRVSANKANSFVRRARAILAKLWGKKGSAKTVPFGDAWCGNGKIIKAGHHGSSADANLVGNAQNRVSFANEALNLYKMFLSAIPPRGRNHAALHAVGVCVRGIQPKVLQARSDNGGAYTGFTAYGFNAFAGLVSRLHNGMKRNSRNVPVVMPQIVSRVRRFHYDGPVYNFASETSVLVAGGIVNHNCRCVEQVRLRRKPDA